jgi:alpha-L-rhamnosidase
LQFELCPAEQREAVADGLAQIVRNDNGWISTGFLGTPLILDALSQNGQAAEAYLMLLRTEIRSWLYPITVGATTIWERWEAIAPDGTPTTGGSEGHMEGSEPSMISFNHYAYGAVVDWIYRNVVGLSLSSPGYRELVVAPLLTKGIDWANGTIETGYGPLGLSWKLATDQTLTGTLTVPFGATAKLQLPASDTSNLTVNGQPTSNGALLNHGDYQFELTKARIL